MIVTGLKPSTQYFYQVGDVTDGFSEVLTFISAPATPEAVSVVRPRLCSVPAPIPSIRDFSVTLLFVSL